LQGPPVTAAPLADRVESIDDLDAIDVLGVFVSDLQLHTKMIALVSDIVDSA